MSNALWRRLWLAGCTAGLVVACMPNHQGRSAAPPAAVTPVTATASTATAARATTPATTSTTVSPSPVLSAGTPIPVHSPGWTTASGDGTWLPAGRAVGVGPAMYTTLLHRSPSGPAIAVTWMDTARLRLSLYAGTTQPSGSWSLQGAVAPAAVPRLLATFNSGFQLFESRGGWYLDGRAAVPLVNGAASVVIYADGSATVGVWGRDVKLTGDVVAIRQNLGLLVDAGTPVSGLGNNILAVWGNTRGRGPNTSRSALGVDAAGHLLYVAGPALDPSTLAGALVAAGAVRGMQLDINPEFVSFDTFNDTLLGPMATKLLPTMYFAPLHFLTPFWRDFFAVFPR